MKKVAAPIRDINTAAAFRRLWRGARQESLDLRKDKKKLLEMYIEMGILTKSGRLTKNYGG